MGDDILINPLIWGVVRVKNLSTFVSFLTYLTHFEIYDILDVWYLWHAPTLEEQGTFCQLIFTYTDFNTCYFSVQ